MACLQRVSKGLQLQLRGVPCSGHQRKIKPRKMKYRGSQQV